jgi:hypothetical protein
MKCKKAIYLLSAAGIIGLASFGLYNTINSVNDLNQTQTAIITNSSLTTDPAAGSGCSPYGCAACSACTNIQYQQDVETISDSTIVYE